jgi:MerR family transcriptional regulator, mercuric resistance operon regulatory protein
MADLFTIGKLATAAGVSADTIRYYERLKLLPRPARTATGYRQYSPAIVRRLALIRNAQRFGFSLREIEGFLRVRDSGGRPCETVRATAQRMLDAVDAQIHDLVARREQMRGTLVEWDVALERTPSGKQARLLETLAPARLD